LRVLGFTLGGLGVAAGLDGAGVADGFDVGNGDDFSVGVNGDADFDVGDSKDDVDEVVLL